MAVKDLFGIAPVFNVEDVARATDHYCDALGFERPQLLGDPPTFAMPGRDRSIVMLARTEDAARRLTATDLGKPWDAYFWVRDADRLFAELRERGAQIEHEPVLREEYGNREFALRDPDGHVLAFGQGMARDSLFAGA